MKKPSNENDIVIQKYSRSNELEVQRIINLYKVNSIQRVHMQWKY